MLLLLAAVVLAVLVPPVLFDVAMRPTIRRLGIRNAVRRPGEAALVVAGSMLATALITASFLIGDSFGASVRSQASTRLGPIDEIVTSTDPVADAALLATADADGDERLFDGLLAARYGPVSVGTVDEVPRVVPDVSLLEADAAGVASFGSGTDGAESATASGNGGNGLEGFPADIAADEVVVNRRTAEALGVAAGDELDVYLGDGARRLTIVAVVARSGLAGFGDVVTGLGTVTAQLDEPDDVVTTAVLVSNVGDDFAGAERSDEASTLISATLGPQGQIDTIKQSLLADADDESRAMTELFGTIGGFSVVAGILLLINLFVMLALERRRELGTLQAIGLGRRELRRAFALEGAVYGSLAAAAGALLGVVVAWTVLWFAADIFGDDADVTIGLSVGGASLVTGAAIGLAISQLTVTVTSARLTAVNIVRALKDVPDPPASGSRWRWIVLGAIGLLGSDVVLWALDDVDIVVVAAPAVGLICAVPLLGYFIGGRAALAVLGTIALGLTAAVFGLRGSTLADPELNIFLLQGVLMVGLAVAVVVALDRAWRLLSRRAGGGAPALRLGLAHPLDRPVRSALLVSMYGLVIFTVTFMAVLNAVFQQQVPTFTRQLGGAFDVVVDSNPTNPYTSSELLARDDVFAAVGFLQGDLEYRFIDDEGDTVDDYWWASAVPAEFPADRGPTTIARHGEFGSDEAVWAAVADGEPWVVVPAYAGFAPGDRLEAIGPGGEEAELVVAATTELNWAVDAGFYVSGAYAAWLTDGSDVITRHYLVAADQTRADELALAVAEDGRRQGASARTFESVAQADVDEQQAFLRLLQGYLGVGLLIGIAGLGVVLIRAVRERRRQLGMMGAIGISRSVVRNMFMVEAAFIGGQGVALGIGLGLLSSWQVLTRSSAFADDLRFAVPGRWLAALGVVAVVASLTAGVLPALRAGRVVPAEALRVTA